MAVSCYAGADCDRWAIGGRLKHGQPEGQNMGVTVAGFEGVAPDPLLVHESIIVRLKRLVSTSLFSACADYDANASPSRRQRD